ncbi:MAG: PVC-type heme-binding CxxCH protein [Fuerstiella sp.]
MSVLRGTVLQVVVAQLMTVSVSTGLNADDFTPVNTQAAGQAPLAPDEAVRRLHVPDDFQITLSAAEPDVRQPIAIAFDDRGRLWVAESYSYDGSTFTDKQQDRILIFEDTNGDGVLDRRRVFKDGLSHLTGLQFGFGGVWITAPPYLAFIPDRNGDDVPDGEAVVHLDGWSLKAEHNSVNGLTWGPDGWLYGRHGIKQPSLVGRPGDASDERVELSCSIWRYHPTRHVFEVVADGTINPWGLDFDDHGQGFLTTSVVEHLWHLVPGAHYERWKDRGVHPNPFVYEAMSATSDHLHWSAGSWDRATRQADGNLDFGGGHSHCDAMIYLGDRWPAEYRGTVFMSNIHGRRVNRDRIVRPTGPYRAVHADDFLVADDPWFRAVSMEYGPDGDVYMTDWSDNGECHDRDGVHRTSGRIYKITWGEPIRVYVNLAQASSLKLVQYQSHDNDWYVRHARRILQERAAAGQDMSEVRSSLQRMFDDNPDDTRKLRAMWALYSIGGADDEWLLSQIHHTSEHVRTWAVRLLVDDGVASADVAEAMAEVARTEASWLVRMTLASALQHVPVGQRWATATGLTASVGRDEHLNICRMIWYAIEPEVAAYPGRAIQTVAALSPRLRRWTARRICEDSSRSVALLFEALERTVRADVLADLLAGVNDGLSTERIESLPDTADRIVRQLVQHQDPRVRVAAVTTAAVVGNDATLQHIRQLLHEATTDSKTRQAALTGLVRRKPSGLAEDLVRLIVAAQLTIPALQAGTAINDPRLAQTVLDRYDRFSKIEQSAAIDLMVARRSSARLLVNAFEQKEISARILTAGQARQIAALNDPALLIRLESIWGTVRPSSADRLRQIKEWSRKLDPSRIAKASLSNGQLVFKKSCGACHKLFGEGRTIGPELTGANRRNLQYLVSNVIDPSAAVPADFRMAIVVTTNGRVITGTISQKTESVVTMQTATEVVQIRSKDIDTMEMSPKSLMPDGLLDKLSETQVRDLFAWMMSSGPAYTTSKHEHGDDLPTVILLGDSIRIGYQKAVAAQLHGKATVWSPQENGQHTVYTLQQLEKWIRGRDAAVVHINVGLHDLFLSSKTDQPRYSLETYSANLRRIFARLKQLTDAEIIFALTTPVDEQRQASSETYRRVVRRNPDIVTYNRRAVEIANECGVRINDIHAVALDIGVETAIRDDGVHLTAQGVDVVGQQVARSVLLVLNGQSSAVP